MSRVPHTFQTEEEYAAWLKRLHEDTAKLTPAQKEMLYNLALKGNGKSWSDRRGG